MLEHVYIKRHTSHAGKWIYEGYKNAWQSLGYTTHYYDRLVDIKTLNSDYYVMAIDADIKDNESLSVIQKSKKAFVYAQPNFFPSPWGMHPNFLCHCPEPIIKVLNNTENVVLWSFGNIKQQYHTKWKTVHTVPLAYDEQTYKPDQDKRYKFDVCFVGGWANNGFDEKRKIMMEHFEAFKQTDLKCGFFVNRNVSQEVENKLLYNSNVSINIHDAYQRQLGLDTNERTFKSLGLNGLLISDDIKQIRDILPSQTVNIANTPIEMVDKVKHYVAMSDAEREEIKLKNRNFVLQNHCYKNRVQTLLTLS